MSVHPYITKYISHTIFTYSCISVSEQSTHIPVASKKLALSSSYLDQRILVFALIHPFTLSMYTIYIQYLENPLTLQYCLSK